MTGIEALKEIKEGISYGFYDGKSLGYYENYFKHLEKELKQPQELYIKIKEKRDDLRLLRELQYISEKEKIGIHAVIVAYNNVLTLMENMFEIEVLK